MKRRTAPKGVKSVSRGFYVQEPAAFIGGWSGFMNGQLALMETALDEEGAKKPYWIEFGGGDGKVSPVTMTMFEAAK